MKKIIKIIFLTILTYLGLAIVLLVSIEFTLLALNLKDSGNGKLELVYLEIFLLAGVSFIGAILTLIGGFIAQPRYSWISIIVSGSIYLLSLISLVAVAFINDVQPVLFLFLCLASSLPGLILIIGGLSLRDY